MTEKAADRHETGRSVRRLTGALDPDAPTGENVRAGGGVGRIDAIASESGPAPGRCVRRSRHVGPVDCGNWRGAHTRGPSATLCGSRHDR